MLPGGGFVVLDTDVSVEQELEGAARDLIREVQKARREAGLDVSDRIALTVAGSEFVVRSVSAHQDLIVGETLATYLHNADGIDDLARDEQGVTEVIIGERYPVRIKVARWQA